MNIFGPSTNVVSEGKENVHFRCSAHSNPLSNFTLMHNNAVLSTGTVHESNEFVYHISMVRRTHYGYYKCQASNEVASAVSELFILEILCK